MKSFRVHLPASIQVTIKAKDKKDAVGIAKTYEGTVLTCPLGPIEISKYVHGVDSMKEE